LVKNNGQEAANDVVVEFSKEGNGLGSVSLGSIDPGNTKEAIRNFLTSEFADCTVYATATPTGQEDANPSDNTARQKVSMSYVDWDFSEDAFNFPNWNLDTKDEHEKNISEIAAFVGTSGYHFPAFFTAFIDSLTNEFVNGMEGGHCYGMAAASILYKKYSTLRPVDNTTTFGMKKTETIFDIKKYFASQTTVFGHGGPMDDAIDQIKAIIWKAGPNDEYEKIRKSIDESEEPIILTMTDKNTAALHAIVGYAILDLGNEKRVYVYDNNYIYDIKNIYPNNRMEGLRYATFDISNNTFLYDGGGRAIYDKVSVVKPKLLLPDRIDRIADNIAFLKNALKNYFSSLILNVVGQACPTEILLIDSSGRRSGYSNGVLLNEIPEVSIEDYEDVTIIYYPSGLNCTIEVTGNDSGIFNLDVISIRHHNKCPFFSK